MRTTPMTRTIFGIIRFLFRQKWLLFLLAWLPLPGRLGKIRRAILPWLRMMAGKR